MPFLRKAPLAAALFMLAFFALDHSADAHEVTITLPPAGTWIDTSNPVNIQVSVTLDAEGRLKYTPKLNGNGFEPIFFHETEIGEPNPLSYDFLSSDLQAYCTDGSIQIGVTVVYYPAGVDDPPPIADQHQSYPCGNGPQPVTLYPDPEYFTDIVVHCGGQNDEVTYSQANVTVTGSSWIGNDLVFMLQANSGYTFAEGTTTTIAYSDANTPCEPTPDPTLVLNVAEDAFVGVRTGDTVTVTATLTLWEGHDLTPWQAHLELGSHTVSGTYQPEVGHTMDIVFNVPVDDDLIEACGTTGQFTASALATLAWNANAYPVQSGDVNLSCNILPAVTIISPVLNQPTVVEVCGPENDIVQPASTQPDGVNPTPQISSWNNGQYTLTYEPLANYAFADGFNPDIVVTDANIDCPIVSGTIAEGRFDHTGVGHTVTFRVWLTLSEERMGQYSSGEFFVVVDGQEHKVTVSDLDPDRLEITADVPYIITDNIPEVCAAQNGRISFSTGVRLTDANGVSEFTSPVFTTGCLFLTNVTPEPPTLTAVCGHLSYMQQNDIFTVDQEGVELDQDWWGNTTLFIDLRPAEGYIFSPGATGKFSYMETLTVCEDSMLSFDENLDVFNGITPGDTVTIPAVLTLPDQNPYDAGTLRINSDTSNGTISPTIATGGPMDVAYTITTSENFAQECADNNGFVDIDLYVDLTGPDLGRPDHLTETVHASGTLPCDPLQPVTPDLDLIVQNAICGPNNDTFTTSQDGVLLTLGEWDENERTITITPATGYYFPNGAPDPISARDENIACPVPSISVVPDVDNPFVDIRFGQDVVPVTVTIDARSGDTNRITHMIVRVSLDGYNFSYTTEYPASDQDWPMVLEYDLPMSGTVLNHICDDGVLSLAASVSIDSYPNYFDIDAEPFDYPCNVLFPVTPDAELVVVTEVCGPNNDEVAFEQENVSATFGEWDGNSSTITFTPAEGFYFPQDTEDTHTVADDAIDCLIEGELELPTVSAVCGPENDEIVLSDTQPEGVDPEAEISSWTNGVSTITYSPLEGYAFPEGAITSFTITDENIPCEEPEPIGKQVTILLVTSDGGSIEGTGYQLFAPVASQVAAAPFAEGEVAAGNQIVFNDLMAGQYRLVLEPEGYEPVNTTFVVTEGTETQEITVEVAALQVPVTPTPSPTLEPTSTPSPDSSPEPTATTAPVSGLPATGSGSTGGNPVSILLAGLSAAIILVIAAGSRRGFNR